MTPVGFTKQKVLLSFVKIGTTLDIFSHSQFKSPILGGQFVNHSSAMPQYQPNQADTNSHQSLPHMQPVSQPYVNQYQPLNEHHAAPGMMPRCVPNMPPQQPTAHSMMPMHYPQQGIPVDASHLNSQHSIPVESTLNHNQPLQQYQPNTVMTTQVQQGVPQPVMIHPNQQTNQPVSSTILPQSNIPVFQQQR